MSLIQAPGSGSILLTRDFFKTFPSLVGLEIKGYHYEVDVTELAGDAFMELLSLTYLNLETVVLQQQSVENDLHNSPRILRINYTFNDIATNEITSQMLILTPDLDDGKGSVLPYFEYKKVVEKEKHQAPLTPKFRVSFTSLPKLQHLKISGCNLHDISWDMFYKLENLKYLLLDENDLLFLPDFVFYATSNLSALSLRNNKILNLQTVGLAGLLYLQKLDVSHNNITHLSELSLPPFPHLEVADFRHNPITSIFPNTFEIMNSTQTLYLGSPTTPLDLSPNSFYGLTSLTKLDITNVKIRLLEKSMLKGMPSLKTLIMTGEIPKISYDAFGDIPNLERLVLRNCEIKKISMDAFLGLPLLTELDLSHNSLTFIPPGIFEEQVALREIYLQHNKLTTLPPSLIENLPVKIIRLEANPWHCSCHMKNWNPQLINRVKRYHIPTPNNTICQRAYDKGSMCFENHEPKFEATYSYEKRVSPICETPLKFNQRSVFQVLRKELRYCRIVEKSVGPVQANKTLSKKQQQLDGENLFPDNYSEATLKALEKQLLAKPVKVKKNRTQSIQQNTNNTDRTKLPQEVEQLQLTQGNSSGAGLNYTTVPLAPNVTLQGHDYLSPPPQSNLSSVNTANVQTQGHNSTSVPTNNLEESSYLPTITVKSKQRNNKKKNKSLPSAGSNVAEEQPNLRSNTNNARLPNVSKKSLKFNRLATFG